MNTSTSTPSAPRPIQKPELQCLSLRFPLVRFPERFVCVCVRERGRADGTAFEHFAQSSSFASRNQVSSLSLDGDELSMLDAGHQAFPFDKHVSWRGLVRSHVAWTPWILIIISDVFLPLDIDWFTLRISYLSRWKILSIKSTRRSSEPLWWNYEFTICVWWDQLSRLFRSRHSISIARVWQNHPFHVRNTQFNGLLATLYRFTHEKASYMDIHTVRANAQNAPDVISVTAATIVLYVRCPRTSSIHLDDISDRSIFP